MTRPGNREIAPQELSALLGGELPNTLPLEGWTTLTLHCQVDAIGPSDQHPDLVKLEVSLPPATRPAPPCRRCGGRRVLPDVKWGEPTQKPCPECSIDRGPLPSDGTCTATMLHALAGALRCNRPAGHYDEARKPGTYSDDDPEPPDPGGWHESKPGRNGSRWTWSDTADGAVPHKAACPTCGPMPLEEHPRLPRVLRCVNCKEHLGEKPEQTS
ncbi:hypothetical protein ABZ468_08115 [Streptomyces sp. NPDC005708]|uniref:hypothetical protein n=1 Tax=Streptomyces sp. NPDC005708 TaxID=3154564 RepID=UPI0033F71F34